MATNTAIEISAGKPLSAAAVAKTDWSSLWKKEDWWAVWVGALILLLGIARWLPGLPQIAKWTDVGKSFQAGAGTLGSVALLFVFMLVLTLVAASVTGTNIRRYVAGFGAVFGLAFMATWLGKYASFSNWGLETVLWALALGLIVSNVWRIPDWLKTAARTEFFIKIGLVLLGAEILFSTIVAGGIVGMGQAVVVVLAVWFFAFWVGKKFGLGKEFSSVMASGVSICGVSAAIAAGGAIKGNPKHVSHVISLVLLVAMPMLVGMPFLAGAMGLSPAMAGAWLGGTIDTTGAVVAAGTLVDPQTGLQAASLVKMAQNVLIGFAAFFLAIWASFSLEKKADAARPRPIEIWYRFPKFILGFVVASVVFSLLVEPNLGAAATKTILGITGGYRGWFFALAFVAIGLETRIKDLVAVGKGRPALAFLTAQAANIVWTLLIVWLLWSGIFFPSPLK
jgi:uncharacterized membrane protein YadS